MSRTAKITVFAIILPALVFFLFANVESAKKAPKGWLGVHVQELTPSLKKSLKIGDRQGVLIPEVVKNSPAEKAGVADGDVLLTFDGKAVEMVAEFTERVRKTEPGTSVRMKLFREGKELEVEVKIGKLKKSRQIKIGDKEIMIFNSGRPRLGVEIHELNADLAPYFKAKAGQGVLVLKVVEESVAAKAGLKAGDVILKVDAAATNTTNDLIEQLSEYETGAEISLEYARAGKNQKVKIELEAMEMDSPHLLEFDDEEIFIKRPGTQKEIIIKQPGPDLKKKIMWREGPGSVI